MFRLALAAALIGLTLASPAAALPELEILTPSDGATYDNFGHSLDVDGDILVIGAPFVDVGANAEQGAVYVFEKIGGVWIEQPRIVVADGAQYDQLGFSVAVSGGTIVAGAEEAASQGYSSMGVAYVFEKLAGVWTQVRKLEGSGLNNLDEYGHAVAAEGDIIAVGAPKGGSGGKVFVYERDYGGAGNWGERAVLTDDIFDSNAEFGVAMDMDGGRLLVGAYRHDLVQGTFNNEGSAYLFARDQGGPDAWGKIGNYFASNPQGSALFGEGVAIRGDHFVVGAWGSDITGYGEGLAYVFRDQGTGIWSEVADLTASNYADFDYFGQSVALTDDMAFVGAPGKNAYTGRVYRYDMDHGGAGNWGEYEHWQGSDSAADHSFAHAMCTDGATFAVSAHLNDTGAVYLFELPTESDVPAAGAVAGLRLLPNHPNPFNPKTTIRFEIDEAGPVRVDVFDTSGRRVDRLFEGVLDAGRHAFDWHAEDLSSGVYLYRVVSRNGAVSDDALLLK